MLIILNLNKLKNKCQSYILIVAKGHYSAVPSDYLHAVSASLLALLLSTAHPADRNINSSSAFYTVVRFILFI